MHRNPEPAFAEHRTAELVADRLRAIGYEPRVGAGGTAIIPDLDDGRPPLPFGTAALPEAMTLMGTDSFEPTVDSGEGHAGLAHQARDAVPAAAQLITITARETSPLDSLGLTIASIAGGTAANVIADTESGCGDPIVNGGHDD